MAPPLSHLDAQQPRAPSAPSSGAVHAWWWDWSFSVPCRHWILHNPETHPTIFFVGCRTARNASCIPFNNYVYNLFICAVRTFFLVRSMRGDGAW